MQQTKRQYFGTDGIRGRVGEWPITPEFMLKLGWAIGKILGKEPGSKVLVGKDTRISGYLFESALEAGLTSAGVDVYLLGPLSTPAIAYLTNEMRAEGGIVISASHNPYSDNGVKIFSGLGFKISDEVERLIELQLDEPLAMVSPEKLGKVFRMKDAIEKYGNFCKSLLPDHFSLQGMKIVLDCANGATYKIAPRLFSELGATVIAISVKPDGLNINEKCGATHLTLLQEKVKETGADLGIAFDGDGDRVMMVDAKSEIVDGDELLFIITRYCLAVGAMTGGVVGTLMTNYGLELAYKRLGLPFLRSKVGDRYVLEMLQQHKWQVGGESSGHLIHLGYTTTGDGIISALHVLKALHYFGKPLNELKQEVKKLPQVTVNVSLKAGIDPLVSETVKSAITRAQSQLGDHGRILLRPSGTEPLLRVTVEGEEEKLVKSLATELADEVKLALS